MLDFRLVESLALKSPILERKSHCQGTTRGHDTAVHIVGEHAVTSANGPEVSLGAMEKMIRLDEGPNRPYPGGGTLINAYWRTLLTDTIIDKLPEQQEGSSPKTSMSLGVERIPERR